LLNAALTSGLTVVYFLYKGERGLLLYAFLMIAANLLAPLGLVAILYSQIKGYIRISNKVILYLVQVLLSGALTAAAFYFAERLDPGTYKGYLRDILVSVYLLPLVYFWVERAMDKTVETTGK